MESLVSAGWLAAPWQIQAALACGYLAYMAAYTGIRGHHAAVDTTFRALAFGLVATLALVVVPADRPPLGIATALTASLAAGLAWRRFGSRLWEKLLRRVDVSWGDDTPTAWQRLISDQTSYLMQISVLTTDDRWIRCDDARRFANHPAGPCILGTNGDVVLYPTSISDRDGERAVDPIAAGWGSRATYLPAAQIRQVNIRRIPIADYLSSEGGAGDGAA